MRRENNRLGAPASPSGSRASHQAASRLDPSGFDPSRIADLVRSGSVGLRVEEDPLSPIPFHIVEVVFDSRDDAEEMFKILAGGE